MNGLTAANLHHAEQRMADEQCWGCQQAVRFHPDAVPMSTLAEVAGMTIGLCDRHWSWWVGYWMTSEHNSGCNAYLIGSR